MQSSHLHCGHCRHRRCFASESRFLSASIDARAKLALQSSPGCANVLQEKHSALRSAADLLNLDSPLARQNLQTPDGTDLLRAIAVTHDIPKVIGVQVFPQYEGGELLGCGLTSCSLGMALLTAVSACCPTRQPG